LIDNSRAGLRTAARTFADQDNSGFPTDTQYNLYLDQASRDVWWRLVGAGWPVNFATTLITATGVNTHFYPLYAGNPAPLGTVGSVVGVYFQQGTDYYPLHRVNEGKRAALLSSTYMPQGFAGFYDVRLDAMFGMGVELLPPPAQGLYKIDYLPEYRGFASDTDRWFGPAGSDEMISLRAAWYGVGKEGEARGASQASLSQMYQQVWDEVQRRATWLDLRNPAQIRDVNSERGRFSFDYALAGPDPVGY
jgi:hypothetical protein